MLRDTYQGGTVAAAIPSERRSYAKAVQRVGLFRWNALSTTRWQTYAVFPPDIRAFGDSHLAIVLRQDDPPLRLR
jgi:hypothetical protein